MACPFLNDGTCNVGASTRWLCSSGGGLGWGAAASARSESMVLGSWEERRGYFSHRQQLQGRLVRGMIGREGVCAAKAKLWLED